MNYNVKLTKEASEQLKALIGIDAVEINVSKGLIKVTSVEAVRQVVEKFAVENVNFKPYEEVIKEKAPEPKPVKDFSLEERKAIIGNEFETGCIVQVDLEEGAEHAVIIDVKDGKYIAARILLRKFNEETADRIPLRKGIDVIYRNLTYKDVVTIVNEVAYELEESDFKKDSGGAILGRVVNEEILDRLALWNQESEDSENDGLDPVSFEEMVKFSSDVESIIKSLWLEDYNLSALARECVSNNTRNMKVLLPAMKKNCLPDLTQQQIKELLESQVEEWADTMLVEMQECSVPYFLKVIQDQLSGK